MNTLNAKRILLIGGNFFPEQTGIGKYNGELVNWLLGQGYACTVLTTFPYYPQWKVQAPYRNRFYQHEVLHLKAGMVDVYRCPQYVPAKPTGSRRMAQELSFYGSSLFCLFRLLAKEKFGYVLTVVPPFYLGLHALLYRFFRGAKFLYHIQDLQIEAARDLGMIRSGPLLNLMLGVEKYILRRADLTSSISPGMRQRIAAKCGKEVAFLPNWVDTVKYRPLPGRAAAKEAFGFSATDFLVLYSGAIGEKQGMELLVRAALLMRQLPAVRLVVCGSGPYKDKLEQECMSQGLDNMRFMPLQPDERFNLFLNMADVHLVLQKSGASDLVMPSKLTTILAVGGLALVTADASSSLGALVLDHQMGLLVPPDADEAFCEALALAFYSNYEVLRQNARRYAEEQLSIDMVLSQYVEAINNGAEVGPVKVLPMPKYQQPSPQATR